MTLSRDKLFSVVRCGMGLTDTPVQLSEDECDELIDIGRKQSIQPIIFHGLKRMNASDEQVSRSARLRSKDLFRFVQHDESLKTIGSVLDHALIPYVFLKGAVLRDLYPLPEMRTSSDIDILVHEEDLRRAVECVEAETDFRILKRTYHDISMVNKRVHLELHFSIKDNSENIDSLLDRAWEYTVPTGAGSRCSFTPEFQMFYVIAHMKHHFLNGGLGIRPFLDLWLLRNKTVYDEAKLRDMCSGCGIQKFYEECSRLADVWLSGAEHTETSELLEEFCLSGSVFGSARFRNAARQRNRRGLRYIVSKVFPPAYQVKEFYKDDSGKEHALPYYYVKRLVSWFSKERRADLNKQAYNVMNIDRDYLDRADKLLKLLEL